MALNMLGMGGVTKNLDATAAKISNIRKDLERIEKLLGQIGGKAGAVNNKVGAPSGLPSSSMFGGTNALFSGQTPIANAPSWSSAIAGRLGPTKVGLLGVGLAAGSTAWNALPDLEQVKTQQQALFQAGLSYARPDYRRMNSMLSTAFGGYASGIGSQQQSLAILSQMGLGNVNNAQDMRFMNSLAATSLITGKSQVQLATDAQALVTPRNKNFLRPYIGPTTTADGRPLALGDIANRIATRSLGANWTQAQLEEALRKGFSKDFESLGGQAGDAISLLRASAAHGGKPITSTGQVESMGLAGKYNPNAITQKGLGNQTDLISASSTPMLTAFEQTTAALNQFRQVMESASAVLARLAYAKGATQTFQGDSMGGAIGGGLSLAGSAIGTALAMKGGGKLVSKLGGKFFGKMGGKAGAAAAAKSGAKMSGKTLGKTLGIASIGAVIDGYDGYQDAANSNGFWKGALISTGTGAVGGGIAGAIGGAGIGAVPGAAIGAAVGFGSYSLGHLAHSLFGSDPSPTVEGGGAGADGGGAGGGRSGTGLIDFATGFVGTPYVWGGRSPKGWDCSGFTQYVFGKYGVTLKRTSDQQYQQGTPVQSLAQAQPGDLLFFRFKDGAKKVVNHVGIYMGGGKMVHAASRKSGTKVATLTKYFLSALVGIRRVMGGKAGRSNNTQNNLTAGSANLNSRGDAWQDANGSGAASALGYGSVSAANISISTFGGLAASASSIASVVAGSGSVGALMMSGGGASVAAPDFGSGSGSGSSVPSGSVNVKTNTNTPRSTSGGLVGNSNAERAFRYLEGKSFTDEAAAGVVGNLMQESGVNPRSRQHGGGPGRGIMQWSVNQRWKQLLNWAGKGNRDPWALGTQLDWMYKEMGSYGVLGKLSHMRDVRAATKYFEDTMEKAGKPNMAARYRYADDALKSYGNDGNLKKYSSGAWAISNDQIAKIHRGEMILPASIAEAVRTSLRSGLQGGRGSSGTRQVIIQVQVKEASDAEAIALARKVKAIIDEDAEYSSIGGV